MKLLLPIVIGLCFSSMVPVQAKTVSTVKKVGNHIEIAGKRYRGSEKIMKIDGELYDVKANGSLRKGWNIFNNHLYYFGSKGYALKHCEVDGIRLSKTGAAVRNLNAQLRYTTLKTLKSLTSMDASKSTKLRAVYNYMGSHRHFYYRSIYPNLSSKTWIKDYAYSMSKTHGGNCYGFASLFSAFAYTIGYRHIYVMTGRVHGNRDGAADGLTRHAWVKIGGYYYDPELNWHGNGAYHRAGYIRANHAYKYDSEPGSRLIRKSSQKYDYYRKNNYYYGVSASSQPLVGIYVIDQHLFIFNKKGMMSVSQYKKLAKLAKEKASWNDLEKVLGKASKTKRAESCYGDGTDIVYDYPHAEFSVFEDRQTKVLTLESFSAR